MIDEALLEALQGGAWCSGAEIARQKDDSDGRTSAVILSIECFELASSVRSSRMPSE